MKIKKHKSKKSKVIKVKPVHSVYPRGGSSLYTKTCGVSLVAQKYGYVTSKQVNALKKLIKKGNRKIVKFRVFPFIPITKKPTTVRMGKGKGTKLNYYVHPICPGQSIVDANLIKKKRRKRKTAIVLNTLCRRFFNKCARKLSIDTTIINVF